VDEGVARAGVGGDSSPVQESFRHSMIVCKGNRIEHTKINPGTTNLLGAGAGI